jgi:hypothetical protein
MAAGPCPALRGRDNGDTMADYGSRWSVREPSWDVILRDRSASRRIEHARDVRPLTTAESAAVREATRAVLGGSGSAYAILEPFDYGGGAFDSRHLDLLREVERRLCALRDGTDVPAESDLEPEPQPAGV